MILPHDSIAAKIVVEKFCAENHIPMPIIDFRPDVDKSKRNLYGFFDHPNTLVINALHCKGPSNNPYSWTWPGYTADLTVLGVTAHELGHYVHSTIGWSKLRKAWYGVVMNNMNEPPIGSYAASQTIEDFAETFKVFVTNPTLLRDIAPQRAWYITTQLCLRPVESRHWREILGDSPRHIRAVENKI